MAIMTTFDPDTATVVHHGSGTVYLADILNAMILATRPPIYRPELYSLWEFSNANLDLFDLKQAREVSSLMQNLADRFKGGAIAVVLRRKVDIGMAKVIMGFASHLPYRVDIFKDVDEARNWLASQRQPHSE